MTQVHAIKKPKPRCRYPALLALFIAIAVGSPAAPANDAKTASPPSSSTPEAIRSIREDLSKALEQIQDLQKEFAAGSSNRQPLSPDWQEKINEERERIESLESRLDALADAPRTAPPAATRPAPAATTVLAPSAALSPDLAPARSVSSGYDNGFFIRSEDKKFSLAVNGLFQVRYTGFKEHDGDAQFGPNVSGISNFDVYLGRMAVSGAAFDPSIHYFLQFQGSTVANGNGITMLDWFVSKTFSKYLNLQAGRYWTPYSYEYYDSPGNYLFADLSSAEYAFSLPRAIGVEASGQAGRLGYAMMVANSVRALDAGGQSNFDNKLAYIGHVEFNILAPYGYVETDPDPEGAQTAELSLWASGAYNPVSSSSGFQNLAAGDTTINATATAGFRRKFFTLQSTGYFRETKAPGGSPTDNSWGFGEQAGYYILPARLELAGRISGVNLGAPHFPLNTASDGPWFAGPGFSYHRVQEDSVGLNYYLHGHHAKIQMSYSYLHGNTFTDASFAANRIWLQTQLMF